MERINNTSKEYGMEISGAKKKIRTKNGFKNFTNDNDIQIGGDPLETLDHFKYLGAIISEDGSKPEILGRVPQATSALSHMRIVCLLQALVT